MEITVITANNFKISDWSGGTTTQFFMYPTSSNYQKLDFDFRLSMATVSVERSIFTALPGVSRTLMVLDGEITLNHESKYSKRLGKLDMDHFEGEWKTSSVGMCTDFNLMTTGNTDGKLASIVIKNGQKITYPIKEKKDWFFVYNYSGKAILHIKDKTYTIHQSDLLMINKLAINTIGINAIEDSVLVFSEIKKEEYYESI